MRRRNYLKACGVLGTGIFAAGCTEEEESSEAEGSIDDGNGGDSGNGEESGENGGSDGSEGGGDGLEITEHEFYEEDFQAGVRGIVQNNTGETLDYVEVKAWFYDDEGVQIDDSLDNTENLQEGGEWRFEVMLLSAEPGDVADYEVEASDSPF